MAHTRRAFSARTDRHDCFSKTTAFTRVVSNDALMKLGGGGDKVCASVCVLPGEPCVHLSNSNSTGEG